MNLRDGAQFKSMENQDDILRQKFMEFPYVSSAIQKNLMVDLMTTLENSLSSILIPSAIIPHDKRTSKIPDGACQACIHIKFGKDSSPIYVVIGTWTHIKSPSGAYLNTTTICAFLKSSTKAPNFVFKLLEWSPTSLILIIDLPHRKDLVLHPDYLKTFYKGNHLDYHRAHLHNLPETKPYMFSSLFLRSAFSPIASILEINVENEEKMDEILDHHVVPVAKQYLKIWLERCVGEDDEKE